MMDACAFWSLPILIYVRKVTYLIYNYLFVFC